MLQCELLCVPTSGSGFYQWFWILAVSLDFASGSGLPEDLDMKTPWARLPALWCDLHTTMAKTRVPNYGIIIWSDTP